jgi:hypothetical protein
MADEKTQNGQTEEEQEHRIGILDIAAVFLNQGAMSLGMLPHPATGEVFISFEAAQESISILEVLQEKTQGNLSGEESEALTSMIDELKMFYVRAVTDPKLKEALEKAKAKEEKKEPSKILTPDGRPASSVGEKPTIILP